MGEPLVINNWQNAIVESPHVGGFSLMRNVDIEMFPGAVKTQKKTVTAFHTALSATFTADAATDICTTATNISSMTTTTCVQLTTTGTLPAGLTTSTNYFVINLSSTTFKLATSIANANSSTAINITDAGTGTHTFSTVNPGTINHIVNDPRTDVKFAIDSNGRVWYNQSGIFHILNGNTLTSSAGNGLAISSFSSSSATYLFVFRNATVDVVNVFGTTQLESPTWSSSWLSLNSGAGSGNSHHAISAQDNIIYFCDDRYVGSIRENSGSTFDPSNGATYTATNNSLDLPVREIAQCLEELGINLLIGGNSFNKIYPWDRTSSSYNLPLPVHENGIKGMKNIGNVVYILAGGKGNIYSTQGTYVKLFKHIPDYMTNNAASLLSNPVSWGGIAARNGALLFGLQGQTSGNSGVYILYADGRALMDNMPSTGSAQVNAIYAANDFYIIGYNGGIDNHDGTRYASYEAVIHSALYRIATKLGKGTYSTLEVQLARAGSGHIRVGYRTDVSSSFTTLATYTTDSSTLSYESDIGLIDIENIQIQVEMDGSPDLLEIRLIP